MSEDSKKANNQVVIDQYLRVLPVLSELMDIGITLVDREKYIFSRPPRTSLVAPPDLLGTPLRPGTGVVKAMEEKRRIVSRVGKEVFGVPYIASAMPIFDDTGELIGSVATVETVEAQEVVQEMAIQLSEAMSTLASNTEEVSAQAQDISGVSDQLIKKVNESLSQVKETNQVLELIKGIAGQTNLLGLNAAIEAARVGDQGRGFGVVAQEIRKLADSTSESIYRIERIIKSVQSDSEYNKDQLQYLVQAISQIADAVGHTATTVQQTSELAVRLTAMANKMFKTFN
ncbi:MAG TPA: methyl-accepting chemotaxis protein [Negativicutes bacterium]